MQELSNNNFGIIIAYLIPGFVTLWGISLFWEPVRDWLATPSMQSPTVGGFLYVTLASLSAGMVVSTVRWAIVDTIHHRTGITPPDWRYELLAERSVAFELLIGHHYRHYQFHANLFVALVWVVIAHWKTTGAITVWSLVGFLALELVLWIGSRDTLRKYYRRGEMLLKNTRGPVNPEKAQQQRILNLEGPFR